MSRLCELPWFKGLYVDVYEVLRVEGRLPSPCDIEVLPPLAVKAEKAVRAAAFAGEDALWFRSQPPDPVVFAHELIHLVRGKPAELEEVYAYNLASLAVTLAERGIKPPASIVRLLDASLTDLEEAVREAYRYPFKDIVDYFEFFGVIPGFIRLKTDPYTDTWTFEVDSQRFDEKSIVIMSVTEIAGMAEYDDRALEALLRVLEKASARRASNSHSSKRRDSLLPA